ncbi:restriction endonuclease [Runella sp.]|jgi:HJR/Mrr/RecB family endonuclease|uniref:restriction endonuclease n=1 Tax=Runella sp. TaxID=1960881 RepID=UPI002627C5C9|nr:restriction endonuclease [Runella sp.]
MKKIGFMEYRKKERDKIIPWGNKFFCQRQKNPFIDENNNISYDSLWYRYYKIIQDDSLSNSLLCEITNSNDKYILGRSQTIKILISNRPAGYIYISDYQYMKEREIIDKIAGFNKKITLFENELQTKAERYADEFFWDEYYGKIYVDIDDVEDGYQFEELIGELFSKKGYNVKLTSKSGDQGIDIVLTDNSGTKIGVQTKYYKGTVSNSAIMQVVGGLKVYNCKKAIVVTNSIFSKSACELAKHNNVLLIDANNFNDFFDSDYLSDVPNFNSYSFSLIKKKAEKNSAYSRKELKSKFLKDYQSDETIKRYNQEIILLKNKLMSEYGISIGFSRPFNY